MNLLCIDTSTLISFVAIQSGNVRFESVLQVEQHSQQLMPQINDALTSSGQPLSSLDAIVVGLGPGSFTALRVGLATVKGLAAGAGIPVIGRSSLAAQLCLLQRMYSDDILVLATDARRGECFVRVLWPAKVAGARPSLDDDERLVEQVVPPSEMGQFLERLIEQTNRSRSLSNRDDGIQTIRLVGSGVEAYRAKITDSIDAMRIAQKNQGYRIERITSDQVSAKDLNLAVGLQQLIAKEADHHGVSIDQLACESLAKLAPSYIRSPEIRASPLSPHMSL